MSRVDDEPMLDPMVRVMQVIILALTSGLLVFLGIVLFLRSQPRPAGNPAQGPVTPVISYAAFAFAAAAVPMSLVIPAVMAARGREQIARGTASPTGRGNGPDVTMSLAGVYQVTLILGAALNEGPAFFALIAYLIEGHPVTLAVACLLTLGVAARFPTRARVDQWIDAQNELLSRG